MRRWRVQVLVDASTAGFVRIFRDLAFLDPRYAAAPTQGCRVLAFDIVADTRQLAGAYARDRVTEVPGVVIAHILGNRFPLVPLRAPGVGISHCA